MVNDHENDVGIVISSFFLVAKQLLTKNRRIIKKIL